MRHLLAAIANSPLLARLCRPSSMLGAIVWGALLLTLPACAGGPLLSDVRTSTSLLQPSGRGEYVDISYAVGQQATITIYLQDASGAQYVLRDAQPRLPSAEPYRVRFDGTTPTADPVIRRRALPAGDYTVVVEALAADGTRVRQQAPLRIEASDAPLPMIENLLVFPETISPNADAVDDVAELTYRLPVTATVDIVVAAPDGQSYTIVSGSEEGPAEQQHVWNGRQSNGTPLPDGLYTYTVRARDLFGNVVERQGTITISGAGEPEAELVYANIAPARLMLGEVLTITIRVRNTGDVPIRTYGPPSGYLYSTNQVFSSVEDGRYQSQPGGFWRVGVDWDANSGGGAKRYPFRWAITPRPPEQWRVPYVEDWLMPGEEAEVIGQVRIEQRETRMSFYVGLIQDGVGFFQDRYGRVLVEVSF